MHFGMLLGVVCWASSGADVAQDQARALIEKAVNAQGGLEALTQPAASHSKIRGVFFGSTEFSGESHSGGAGKMRLTMHFKEQGSRLIIINGAKGWSQFNGVTQEMDETTLERTLKARYVDRVCGLTTLLRDKGYTFTVLAEIRVDDKPASGVKVASEGHPEVDLYFDKASGFLAKSVFRQPQADGREALMEAFYRDYQPVDNAAEAEKTLRDAQRGTETAALLAYLAANTPGAETRQEIQKLIDRLGNGSFAVREQASSALIKHGIKAGALLQKARLSRDVEVTRRATRCLESLADESELAGAAVRLLNVRRAASAEVLLTYLPWAPDDKVSREVQDALLALIRKQAKPDPIWQKVLQHEDARIRQMAAAALGKDDGVLFQQPGQRLFVEGLRLARQSSTFVDGQKRLDLETTDRAYFNRLDESLFEPADE